MINKRKPRILVVVRWPVGGIKSYLSYVYTSEQFKGYEFDFLMPSMDGVEELQETLALENITFNVISGSVKSFYWAIVKTILKSKYDLVHSHGFTAGVVSVVPTKIASVKHIMTAHEVFTKKQFEGIKGRLKRSLMSILLSKIDLIQNVSEGAKSNICEYFPVLSRNKSKDMAVILNGIDSDKFKSGEIRDLRSELSLSEQYIIGFLGRFMSPKGFKYLILAMQQLIRDEGLGGKIKLVAFGSDGFVREDTQWVSDIGLKDHVVFLPETSQVAETLRGLDLLVMPSLWEACGLLAMEALVAGTPVIGSNCDGLDEVLEGTPAYKVKPKDIDGLAKAIKYHYQHNRVDDFKNYAAIAADRFNVTHVVTKLKFLYDSVI